MAAAGAGTLDLLGGLGHGSQNHAVSHSRSPSASQLTIFYSGTINVYNNVPADKAHALMLLLASADEKRNRAKDAADAPLRNVPAFISPSSSVPPKIFRQPFSRSSTPPASHPVQPFHAERKLPQHISKRTQAELPFARKASLARFLEKRKDRVQAKGPGSSEEEVPDGTSKKLKVCDDEIAQAE